MTAIEGIVFDAVNGHQQIQRIDIEASVKGVGVVEYRAVMWGLSVPEKKIISVKLLQMVNSQKVAFWEIKFKQ